ncbi:MAG: hypothetical protein QOE35_1850 [Actinomycetota bacterium]|jgi:hypothetical protein
MQFVILIYQGTTPLPNTEAWESLSDEEQRAIYADYAALNDTPGLTAGLPLGLPEDAKAIRVEKGRTLTADGPVVDSNGAVGGYFVLEADDVDAAIDIAARIPAARHGGAVEVRPVATYW